MRNPIVGALRASGFMALLVLTASPAHAVTIDWVTVGNPGNAPDDTGYGAVADVYRIGKYEVTNAQYAEFLNAVADADAFNLYNAAGMGANSAYPSITRTGSSGSYSYSAIAGRENMPVNYVSFWDSVRFVNWLNNGQGSGDTETGAYTITPEGIAANSITRNPEATIFLPSEDEWYKAAYFDGTSYLEYPTGWDAVPICEAPPGGTNSANCNRPSGDLTDVGSYTGSASPYGTFDQGGNVWERNEAILSSVLRGERGGSFFNPNGLPASERNGAHLTSESYSLGFRVATTPEPSTALLFAIGLAGLAAAGRRRS